MALPQGRRRFPLNGDAAVRQRKLSSKVIYSHVQFMLTDHCTLLIDSSSLGKSLDSTGYMPAKTCRYRRHASILSSHSGRTHHGFGRLKARHGLDSIPDMM
jgi:hypothetical protein